MIKSFAVILLFLTIPINSHAAIFKDAVDTIKVIQIMKMSNPDLTIKQKKQYISAIMKYSKKESLDPKLIAAIIHVESNFVPTRKSKKGAIGPMGVIPKYHKDTLKEKGIRNVATVNHGVYAGVVILKGYLEDENWNLKKALKKYGGFIKKNPSRYYNTIISVARS